jgi:hypothetical protein
MYDRAKADRYYASEQDARHPKGCSCRDCLRQSGDTRPEWQRRAAQGHGTVRVDWGRAA